MAAAARSETSTTTVEVFHRARRLRLLWTATVLGSAVLASTSPGVRALFADSSALGGNAFASGRVSLSTDSTSALVTYSNMAPGDSVTSPVLVTNDVGSASLRYSIAAAATNGDLKGLKDQLVLTVKTVDLD